MPIAGKEPLTSVNDLRNQAPALYPPSESTSRPWRLTVWRRPDAPYLLTTLVSFRGGERAFPDHRSFGSSQPAGEAVTGSRPRSLFFPLQVLFRSDHGSVSCKRHRFRTFREFPESL